MKTYLLYNETHPLDDTLEQNLKEHGDRIEHIAMPDSHEDLPPIFTEKEGGIIFLPQIWDDLFCVKVINEIQNLKTPFEAVIIGPQPSMSDLIVAFNGGLAAYLETPIDTNQLKQVIKRSIKRLKQKTEHTITALRLADYEGGKTPHYYSAQMVERDQLLGHAIEDIINEKGPLADGTVSALLVASSKAQHGKLESLLMKIGVALTTVKSIEEALATIKERKFTLVITDNVLSDGDSKELVNHMRKTLKNEMPRFLVWSATIDKAADLLKPEHHIDDVIIKPGPGTGIESVLPTILAGIYSNRIR